MKKGKYITLLLVVLCVVVVLFVYRTPPPPTKKMIIEDVTANMNKELYVNAIDDLEAFDQTDSDVELLLLKAKAYAGLQQAEEEIAVYEQIIKQFPTEKRAYLALLKLYQSEYPKKYLQTLVRMQDAFPNEEHKELQEYRLGFEKVDLPASAIDNSQSEFFIFQNGKHLGVMNKELDIFVDAQFDKLYDYSMDTGYFGAVKDGKAFYIDENGYKRQVSDITYQEVGYQHEQKAFAKRDGKFGYIDYHLRELTPFEFDDATSFHNGIAAVKNDKKWRFINAKFETLSDMPYDDIVMDRNKVMNEFGVIWVKQNGKWQLLDEKLNVIKTPELKQVKRFMSLEPTAVELTDGWGFITVKGEVVNPQRFLDAQPFNHGKTFVKTTKQQWVLISDQFVFGKIIEAKHVSAIHNSGVAKVTDENKNGYFIKLNDIVD